MTVDIKKREEELKKQLEDAMMETHEHMVTRQNLMFDFDGNLTKDEISEGLKKALEK